MSDRGRPRPGPRHQLGDSTARLGRGAWRDTYSGWDRHTGLSAGLVDPSRGVADCARRSPDEATEDPGSIPGTSTMAALLAL